MTHFLDIDGKFRVLAGEFLAAVFRRKGNLDLAMVARPGANELVLEAGDEPAGPQFERMSLRTAAGKRLAVDLADEIDDDDIAIRRRLVDRLALAIGLGDTLHRLVNLLLRNLRPQPLELQLAEVDGLDLGQQLDRHLEFEISALLE